ncbi:MAG: ATP-binding protein, partial [Candidatus Thorarchaeota archaeon]|nr:ATP-binding protein [Candidatus Thorarchaeota archaeon]
SCIIGQSPILVAIRMLKPNFTNDPFGRTIRIADLLTLPKRDVVLALRNAEENQAMVQLMLDLLSHDIKNYNQSAHMFLELIEAHNPDLDKRTTLNIENAKLILKESIDTVSNLLILNRVQDGVIQLDVVDLGEFFDIAIKRVKDTYATVSVDVENKPIFVGIKLESHVQLIEALYNILANVVKHRSDEAENVVIDLFVKEEKQHIVLGIGDKGPGIADNRKEEIFQRFQKRGQKGVGLSIVRQILARLNSEIWVENRPESPDDHSKGSVFYIKLPSQKKP